jgi:hypothetical protein
MADTRHPTNDTWSLFDPLERAAPRGASLLLINEGGSLITGIWYDGCLAWGFKPKIPASVKARETAKLEALRDQQA